MYKTLTSPIMYGSKPEYGLKNAVLRMYSKYSNHLSELDKDQLDEFMLSIEYGIYDILPIPEMINRLFKHYNDEENIDKTIGTFSISRLKIATVKTIFPLFKDKSIKYKYSKVSDEVDLDSVKRSILPNFIHNIESLVTHHFISKPYTILTIHDAFYLKDITENEFQKEYSNRLFYECIKHKYLLNLGAKNEEDIINEYNNNKIEIEKLRNKIIDEDHSVKYVQPKLYTKTILSRKPYITPEFISLMNKRF